MKTYRFLADLRCTLSTGQQAVLKSYPLRVEGENYVKARSSLRAVATEVVGDAGGNLLDAPLESLTVHNIRNAV